MHCYARYIFIAMIAVLGLGNILTGCGSKGDLYLPESGLTEPARQPVIEPVAR